MKETLINLKSYLDATKINVSGKTVNRKLVILESDDWGAIRTPSKEIVNYFEKSKIDVSKSIYKNDALESQTDLELLFDVLHKHKGSDGQPAIMTANAIMANPDFKKIKESDFQNYFWEPFYTTFQHYPEHQNNLSLWKKGMELGVFQPQFHGREHVNIHRWMSALKGNSERVRELFDFGTTFSGIADYSFMESFDWNSPEEVETHKKILAEGLAVFETTFGFASKSFIAPCYTLDSKLNSFLASQGIEWMQGTRSQLQPTGTFNRYTLIRHSFGQENNGLRYNVRNCFFEPSMLPSKNWVDSCLAQIQTAFLFSKPAVICSHRINYIGFINHKNRDRGLHDLNALLKAIVTKWPDVRFITTDQLSEISIQ
ncbi:MAG: hypothetical protein IM568_14195 [Flavobacterium sp.]|nr:hypothetical protein [Flavobacterium sp.]